MDTAVVTPTAPTSAPVASTSPAAPATSAPSTPQTPDQRPSFAQAFANDAAQQPTESSAQPEGATTPPAEASTEPSALHPSTETKQGPIPFDVHQKSMDNARLKATQELQATFDRDYGWAKELPKEKLVEWSGIASLMASDPPAFLEKYFAETVQHPTFGPHVKSWAAKTLATRVQADTMPGPDVQIVDQQGNVTGMSYSATQLEKRDVWREKQLMGQVEQIVQPLQAEREQKQREANEAEEKRQFDARIDQGVGRVAEALDITDETPKEERQRLMAAVGDLLNADRNLPIDTAIAQVRRSHAKARAQTSVLEDLKTKAAAQGMNPSRAGVATTHKPTSFLDKSLEW